MPLTKVSLLDDPLAMSYAANVAGNVSVTRSLAVGFTDGRVPQANLDVKGNTYISGATTITGKLTSSSVTPAFYGANVTGNASVTRSLAVGFTDGRIPRANLEVKGNTYISGVTTLAGALTLGGAVAGADNQIGRVNLIDYGEVTNAIGGTGGGTQDIDLTLGNSVSATVDTNANTFTFSNPTASDEMCAFSLVLTNGGSQTVNWPGSVDWASATAPTLTSSGVDILVFITVDGGTIWHGMVASTDSS